MKKWLYVTAVFCLSLPALHSAAEDTSSPDDPALNILGGTPAEKGEFPWMVHLEVPTFSPRPGSDEPEIISHFCGGTLLSPTLVLTAGHCVGATGPLDNALLITVTQGVVDPKAPEATVVFADFVYRSPNFSNFTVPVSDWALVRLIKPISNVAPVRLALDQSLHDGVLTTMGWGRTSQEGGLSPSLLKVDVDFIDDVLCQSAGYLYSTYALAHETMCAGNWNDGGVGSCRGDSGGPLVKLNPIGEWIQVGVTSWGEACGEPQKPAVYAEVQYFLPKICEAAEMLGSQCALVVTNPDQQFSTVGTAVAGGSVQSTAKYGTPGYTWSVTGLPPGVQMSLPFNVWPQTNSRAEFIGTPTSTGAWTVTVTATDSSDPADSSSVTFVWNILPPPPPSQPPPGYACPVGQHCCEPNPNGGACLTCITNSMQCP